MPIHRPGQYARSRVNRGYLAFALGLGWALLVSVATVSVVGASSHLNWKEVAKVGLVWGIGGSVAVLYSFHRPDIRSVLNWWKGARGEELVGECLSMMEPEGYRAVHDIDARFGNIDHVVAGPTGVFALETKAWRGRVWLAKGAHLKVGRRDEDRALEQARAGARQVHAQMKAIGLTEWVEAVIVLTATSLPKGRMRLGAVHVIELADLPDFIRSREHRMSSLDAARVIAAVYLEGERLASTRAR